MFRFENCRNYIMVDFMLLDIADQWYETLSFADQVTLIRETHVSPDLRCNIWHVRGRDRVLLIDTGMGLVSLRDKVSQLAGREIMAVASHTHFDHIGCHHEFKHRLCHPLEAGILCAPTSENTVWAGYAREVERQKLIEALPYAGFSPDEYRVLPAPPTRLIEEGDEIDLGNRLFTVFHMPGHSPGSVCLYESATATLFTGDVLYDGELLDRLYHSDRERYRETMARLKELPAETFHCGHYASFGRDRMIELADHYLHSTE